MRISRSLWPRGARRGAAFYRLSLVWGFAMNALAQLGMVSDFPSENQTLAHDTVADSAVTKDYFVERDGVKFAGTHLLIDLWGAQNLDDPALIDVTLRDGALAAGATILHSHFHHFTPNGGVSGVVVLAESHISIHTWPERGFAAVDIFMCGECDPYKAVAFLRAAFSPSDVQVGEQRRGLTS
jgi:S-adenosylmethionine decarboxylase